MGNLLRGLRTFALYDESRKALAAEKARKEVVRTAAEKQSTRGLTQQQTARLRLTEAFRRTQIRNEPSAAQISRGAALVKALEEARRAGKPLASILRKR